MSQGFFPLYFRGPPKDPEQIKLLNRLFAGTGVVEVKSAYRGLPQSARVKKVYRPELSDVDVLGIYTKPVLRLVRNTFGRLLPVLPCPSFGTRISFEVGLERTLLFLRHAFPNVEREVSAAKTLIFIENQTDQDEFDLVCGLRQRSSRRFWMKKGRYGWVYVLPLYDRKLAISLLGELKDFLEKPNDVLARIYPSVANPASI